MKAIVHKKYGPPSVVQLRDIPKPIPGKDEVLIKVYASTVNRTDCGFRKGKPYIVRLFSGIWGPKSQTLGNEFAGEIETIGENVTSFKTGDKVFGFDDSRFGGHAEYMVLQEKKAIAIMPSHFSYIEAAPLAEGAHYALSDLRAAKIKAGQKILINGATGAIGSAAVQLCKHFGLSVTAVCSTENVSLVAALGADKVIDYREQDFTKLAQEYDVVFDAVGKSSFGKCKRLLKKKGIYMSTELGAGWQNILLALITPLLGGRRVLFPIPTINKEVLHLFKELAEKEKYKPVIDKQYTLEQTAEAYCYVETGYKIGNVVITIR